MKLTFKRKIGKLFPVFCEGKYGDVVLSSTVDDIIEAILDPLSHNAGTITHSFFKVKKTCIGVKPIDSGRWRIVYSNTPAAIVGNIVRICDRGFRQNVGFLKSAIVSTHYFIIETYCDESGN